MSLLSSASAALSQVPQLAGVPIDCVIPRALNPQHPIPILFPGLNIHLPTFSVQTGASIHTFAPN